MKRLRRWLFNTLAAISMLIFLTLAVLWHRTFRTDDDIDWYINSHMLSTVRTHPHGIDLTIDHYPTLAPLEFDKEFDYSTFPYDVPRAYSTIYYQTPFRPAHSIFGFGWEYNTIDLLHMPDREFLVAFPLWFPIFLSTILPILWLKRHLLHHHRARLHLCQYCGYDLRATPSLCPECGTVPTKSETISIRPNI